MKFLLTFSIVCFLLIPATDLHAQDAEPPYGLEELQAYSVFLNAYRSDDYDLAILYGEWMLVAMPENIEGHSNFSLERQFRRMVDIYTAKSQQVSDPSESAELLGKAEDVFQKLFRDLDTEQYDAYDWRMRFGRFYHEYHEELRVSITDAIEQYEKMFEIDPVRFANESDGYFAGIVLTRYVSTGEGDKANKMLDVIEPHAGPDLQATIEDVRESLFEGPEERIEFILSRLPDAEGNHRLDMLDQLAELYEETGQTEQAVEIVHELYQLNPDFSNTLKLAESYLSDGNYSEALQYLNESLDLAENDHKRGEVALQISESYQQLGELEQARDYARMAENLLDNPAAAYMRIQTVYASTISYCTSGGTLERNDRTVYWLVIDYLEKAKAADPTLSSQVNRRIVSLERAMPSAEDKFFSGWETGNSFRIDGNLDACYDWVNETTTVR